MSEPIFKQARDSARLRNEVRYYRAMETVAPPFDSPRLLAWRADGLTVTRLPGRVLGEGKLLNVEADETVPVASPTPGEVAERRVVAPVVIPVP